MLFILNKSGAVVCYYTAFDVINAECIHTTYTHLFNFLPDPWMWFVTWYVEIFTFNTLLSVQSAEW